MNDPYYADFDRIAKLYRPTNQNEDQSYTDVNVITEQPERQTQGYGTSPPDSSGLSGHQFVNMISPQIGIGPYTGPSLPGFDILQHIPFIKIHKNGIFSGGTICSPGYKITNVQGDLMLKGSSDLLFCPFDSKLKGVSIKDLNDDCIFQVKFTPSVCECDSEEKRCFAIYCPVYENPFGAIIFESGQLKYSLKILNALEGETYAVQFLGNQDITIKGADGTIVAIINLQKKRGESQKYTLTFTEELSSANKALFIGCIITLDLVSCEADCSKIICISPLLIGVGTILGLTLSHDDSRPSKNNLNS